MYYYAGAEWILKYIYQHTFADKYMYTYYHIIYS